MSYGRNRTILGNARSLRQNMTKEERHLWYDYLRSHPLRFLRQKGIDCYIVDFYCHSAKLVVELDGSQHFEEAGLALDLVRDKFFEEQGLNVLRFSNSDINSNFDGVCTEILKHLDT